MRTFTGERNYENFLKYVESSKNGDDCPIDNNTRVIRHIGHVAIKLHNTEIVTYYKSGWIELNSGGWLTVTTKDRMNTYSPIRVWANKRVWYVTFNNKTYLYEDHMSFNLESGNVYGGPDKSELAKECNPQQIKNKEKELKRINNYVKNFIDKFLKGEIAPMSSGDCWYCLSHVQGSGIPPIQTLNSNGVVTDGFDETHHIRSHIKSKYYVPSLLFNAIKETPHLSQMDKYTITQIYNGGKIENNSWLDLTGRNLRSTLSRYIRKQLGYQIS
jgi:hypothetical protein